MQIAMNTQRPGTPRPDLRIARARGCAPEVHTGAYEPIPGGHCPECLGTGWHDAAAADPHIVCKRCWGDGSSAAAIRGEA